MKVDVYNKLMAWQASRRTMLKGAAALGASSALSGVTAFSPAQAAGGLRAEILKIPGVGKGSP